MITGHGARVIKLYDPVITVLSIAVLSITVLSIADQLAPLSSLKVTTYCLKFLKKLEIFMLAKSPSTLPNLILAKGSISPSPGAQSQKSKVNTTNLYELFNFYSLLIVDYE